MCFGVFVQVNEDTTNSRWPGHPNAKSLAYPIGYVIQENGCWDWVGGLSPGGYGQWGTEWQNGRASSRVAHRVIYERAKGPIPKGLTLDHLCRNRKCVNPDHLEPVTNAENLRRGTGISARNAKKTHCPSGHAYDKQNTRYRRSGHRVCRECANARLRALYHKNKALKLESDPDDKGR